MEKKMENRNDGFNFSMKKRKGKEKGKEADGLIEVNPLHFTSLYFNYIRAFDFKKN